MYSNKLIAFCHGNWGYFTCPPSYKALLPQLYLNLLTQGPCMVGAVLLLQAVSVTIDLICPLWTVYHFHCSESSSPFLLYLYSPGARYRKKRSLDLSFTQGHSSDLGAESVSST